MIMKQDKWSNPKKKKVGRPKGKGRYYKITGITPTGERYQLGYTSNKTAFTRYHKEWMDKGYRFEYKTLHAKEKT